MWLVIYWPRALRQLLGLRRRRYTALSACFIRRQVRDGRRWAAVGCVLGDYVGFEGIGGAMESRHSVQERIEAEAVGPAACFGASRLPRAAGGRARAPVGRPPWCAWPALTRTARTPAQRRKADPRRSRFSGGPSASYSALTVDRAHIPWGTAEAPATLDLCPCPASPPPIMCLSACSVPSLPGCHERHAPYPHGRWPRYCPWMERSPSSQLVANWFTRASSLRWLPLSSPMSLNTCSSPSTRK
jgi:hypothetical protein